MRLKHIIFAVLLWAFTFSTVYSQELPVLRWAADAESGAPYVYHDAETHKLVGFEVEIVEAVARELKMKPVHVQNQWDGLVAGFARDDYDVVVNGLEITAARKKVVDFSIPYYITYESIIVRKDQEGLETLASLIGKTVGTLSNSYAEKLLNAQNGIDVRAYESEYNSFNDLKHKRLDAVLIDFPVALYYAKPDPELKIVGGPIGQISYGITLRKKDSLLLKKINVALLKLSRTGELREILEKWQLWDEFMERSFNEFDPDQSRDIKDTVSAKLQDFINKKNIEPSLEGYWKMMPDFGRGALMTIGISVLSMMLAILLGLSLALTRVYGPPPFSYIAVGFIELIRGTPLLIQLFFIFYALPQIIGLKLDPFSAAIIGLGVNYAAYEAENYRAGLFSVPRGQMEAAISLGMKRSQALRHIIIPQAVRLVIPPLTNDFISLLKDSSLVSVITMVELTKTYSLLAASNFDYIGTGIIVAVIYLLLGLPFVKISKIAEEKFSIDKNRRKL